MITRDVAAAAQRDFDLVVVGGGIYGVSLLQEAARRGLSACFCEAADFGGGTNRRRAEGYRALAARCCGTIFEE